MDAWTAAARTGAESVGASEPAAPVSDVDSEAPASALELDEADGAFAPEVGPAIPEALDADAETLLGVTGCEAAPEAEGGGACAVELEGVPDGVLGAVMSNVATTALWPRSSVQLTSKGGLGEPPVL